MNELEEQGKLLKKLEDVNEKLIASEKLKSQFLSNIRNEINNPLTSILGLSKKIPSYVNDEDALERVSRLIYQEAFSLDFQLRNVFVAAELESGTLFPENTKIEIEHLVEQIIHEFNHLIVEKELSVNLSNESGIEHFNSDAEKIHLILSNLISNAIGFSNPKGAIDVTINQVDNKLQVSIKDYGIGIDEKNHEVIYDRFKQLDAGSTKNHLGHGLGLSVTKELLEMIGGSISLESEPDKGSKFTFEVEENKDGLENLTLGGNEFLFDDGEDILF